MISEEKVNPYYAMDEGSAYCTTYDLFIAEKYPRGLPFNPKQTHEEWKAETAALFAEFQLWKWANPIAIRVNKLDRKEAQEAGVENMLDE